MKTPLALLLLTSLAGSALAGSFGPGPWADGAYYPGGLNGKYMGVVTGNNISGVLGFAIVDGAPPYREQDVQTASGDEGGTVLNNLAIRPDPLQNYFAIFVEGRTYTGLTTAGVDIDSKVVAGALEGTAPPALLAATSAVAADGGEPRASDALTIINRGLSGGFTAKVKKSQSIFTFKGQGELSTPANNESFRITAVPQAAAGVVTNIVVSGQYQTDTTPFDVSGIRTSFLSSNPAAQQDAADQAAAGGQ